MTITPNLGLSVHDTASGSETTFLTWRLAIDGVSSDMSIIDSFAGDVSASIITLEGSKPIIRVNAYYTSPGYYEAVGVANFDSYITNMVVDLVLDVTNASALSLNVNTLGSRDVKKIDSSGCVVVIVAGDLILNKHNLFTYDGAKWLQISGGTGGGGTTSGSPKDFSDQDLTGMNFSSLYLSGANFGNSFVGVYPSASGINLDYCYLKGANFAGFWTFASSFWGAYMEGCNLAGSEFYGDVSASMYCYLSYNVMDGCNAAYAIFDECYMDHSAWRGANMGYARFYSCDLHDTKLDGVFGNHAHIEDTSLLGCTIKGASFDYSDFWSCNFPSNILNSSFVGGYFSSSSFTASYSDATFLNCNFMKSDFWNCRFNNALFDTCNLSYTRYLTTGSFTGTQFHDCNFSYANFTGRKLYTAKFDNCNLTGVNFTNCDLTNASFVNATNITNCTFTGASFTDTTFAGAVVDSVFKNHIVTTIESNASQIILTENKKPISRYETQVYRSGSPMTNFYATSSGSKLTIFGTASYVINDSDVINYCIF